MGNTKRKYHSAEFKSKVAIEAIQQKETINQIASKYEIHPNLVTTWKSQFLENAVDAFSRKHKKPNADEPSVDELYQEIGKLKIQLDWIKKKYEAIQR